MISDEELLLLSQRGLIAGPGEKEEAFLERVKAFLAPHSHVGDKISSEEWNSARQRTKELFGVEVDWVAGFYSKQDLPLWQGAVTWIEEGSAPLIQLRPTLRHRALLGIYKRNEILAHESIHAARTAFEEPRFEELLAYQTSSSCWRRYFGPLFRSNWETMLFFFSLMLFPLFQIALFFLGIDLLWLLPLPFLAPAYFLIRLIAAQRTFLRCCKALQEATTSPLHVLLRLTDDEISQIAAKKEIKKSKNSLRWRQINLAYFQKRR